MPKDDPQFIGQALVFSLNAISEISSCQLPKMAFDDDYKHPVVERVKNDHSLDQYQEQFHEL